MCDDQHALRPLDADEYVLDTELIREFVGRVRAQIDAATTPGRACELIEPLFGGLLLDQTWLPEQYQAPAAESGMGGGIGQWLLFRAADRSLSLFSLVVAPASARAPTGALQQPAPRGGGPLREPLRHRMVDRRPLHETRLGSNRCAGLGARGDSSVLRVGCRQLNRRVKSGEARGRARCSPSRSSALPPRGISRT